MINPDLLMYSILLEYIMEISLQKDLKHIDAGKTFGASDWNSIM